MNTMHRRYCLDSNVLIQAWRTYYAPRLCTDYWRVLDELGDQHRVFIVQEVFDEIDRIEDGLNVWLRDSRIPVRKADDAVGVCLKNIYSTNEEHRKLVDNAKNRSLADPWIIAHALNEGAAVVTKEERINALNTRRIRIPNVCENMGIVCMNDFDFLAEQNIRFGCGRHS